MIADSLSGVHIPLPAVRPRQRSWGTSLPQSVILCCIVRYACQTCRVNYAYLGYDPLHKGTAGPVAWLPLVFGVMSNRDGPM